MGNELTFLDVTTGHRVVIDRTGRGPRDRRSAYDLIDGAADTELYVDEQIWLAGCYCLRTGSVPTWATAALAEALTARVAQWHRYMTHDELRDIFADTPFVVPDGS